MQRTYYHSILRIASLTCALVLLFDSGLVNPVTKELSRNTRQYLAQAVSMNASVTPNELNQLTAELTAQKKDLAEREAALKEREIAVNLNQSNTAAGSSTSTFILSIILFILLVLIVLNYVLDYLRRRPLPTRSVPQGS